MSEHTNLTLPRTEHGLRPNSLGVAGIVFFVVAAASPLSAILGASPAAVGAGNGVGAPSSYLLAGVLLLIFSVGYSAMARFVPSGGGFAAYVQTGLGDRAGRAAGYLAAVAYTAMLAGLYGIFGFFANFIFADFGIELPWWAWSLITMLLVGLFGYLDIDLSAKVLGVVMILEILVLLVVSAAILFTGGADGINVVSFTPEAFLSGSLAIGLLFAFASFIGFEATSIYSEEARNRERTIPRATYTAVIIITVFLAFSVWSFVIGYGTDEVQAAAASNPDEFVLALAAEYVSPAWATIMMVLLITSFFAALLAFQNTIARYFRTLSMRSWLPSQLSRTHAKFHSPHIASLLTSAISLVLVGAFALLGLDPYGSLFMWLVGLGTLSIISLQAVTSAAILIYFSRNRSGLSPWRTLVAPAVGTIGLITAAALAMANWDVLVGSDSGVSQLLPWLIPIVLVLGIALPLRRTQL